MRIALVHELLTMRGGAERVLRIAADMFPDAPIYTLLYNEKKLGDWFPRERVRTPSFSIPHSLFPTPYKYNHHLYLSKFPQAVEHWDFSDFDVVLSFSSAFTHGIITNGAPKHICYVHSPARYLWDRTHDVLERAGRGPLGPIRRRHLERVFHKLRMWDAEVAPRPDKLLAASQEVKRRIELYWRRDADVVYPPIDDFWLTPNPIPNPNPNPYFLIVSTLVPYKRIEIAIQACNELNVPLKIAGTGADKNRLKNLAGPTVEFLGYQSEETLKDLYTNATALLFPGDEDFGLVPLESMACGTPVIAFRSGGATETVTEGKTGEFFDEPTSESLQRVLQKFDQNNYSTDVCKEQAQQFSRGKFEKQIRATIETL